MKLKTPLLLIIALLDLAFFSNAYAGSCGSSLDGSGETHCSGSSPWTSDSVSYEDVDHCVNTCAGYGDKVNVPEGTASWTVPLLLKKGIIFSGSGFDKTIINGTGNGSTASSNTIVNISPDAETKKNDYSYLVEGFTFHQNTSVSTTNSPALYSCLTVGSSMSEPLRKIVIRNNRFSSDQEGGARVGIYQNLGVFGVVYNNSFLNLSHSWRFLGGTAAGWLADEAWVPGTENAMYYEDNLIFTTKQAQSTIISGGRGNRYVARYNTFDFSGAEPWFGYGQWLDIHGIQVAAGIGLEFYGNQRIGGGTGPIIDQRGGQVFIFFNQWKGSGSPLSNPTAWSKFRTEWHSDNPDVGVLAPESCVYPVTSRGFVEQNVRDSYYWSNFGGPLGNVLAKGYGSTSQDTWKRDGEINDPLTIVENKSHFVMRDFNFNGNVAEVGSCGVLGAPACISSGVGCGTYSQIQSIVPSIEGLGFWATDQGCDNLEGKVGRNPTSLIQGTLYRSVSNGSGGYSWKPYYTPYTYPHPLRNEGDKVAPSSPARLNVR